ncbi:MAG: bifunctional phosphoribosylaminoimidazolecarboxamide formyltransferase/IMP cyclohydrolase [Acidobacteria bacterium]|nr:bifunctional phosphoribosylaminoimidazolecarboxamide formyltransferase/IMP cyclohydrolase [Acidobacteriota bacterium]MCA1643796.1 bifunctional phosphoribosylaminoimidazolecarboxamide formyltransferase/IMP cyclohydrolase [Acidobacteriota bacterium]
MTEKNDRGLRTIRRAVLSVSDKAGLIEFARGLREFGVELLSTGGTASALRQAGLDVRDVSEVTGFPEMLDGRVKTLHPRVHGGLLAVRDNEEHVRALAEHGIEPIDMVVINLYPFERTIARAGTTLEEAIEQIDIGGPAMIRSASKNYRDVAVIVAPDAYTQVLEEMRANGGALTLATRARLARTAFLRTATYDGFIVAYLSGAAERESAASPAGTGGSGGVFAASGGSADADAKDITSIEDWQELPDRASWTLRKTQSLRYGENPHQRAALYDTGSRGGVGRAELISGKEMSYNNFVDADAAWQLVCDFDDLACAIIKHTNPAGVALGASAQDAYRRALATDPTSAFGGIVAFNRTVGEAAARAVVEIFTEVVVAPDFDAAALEVLRAKKNLRVLRAGEPRAAAGLEYKQIAGGMLVQTRDTHRLARGDLRVVSKRAPSDAETGALLFAWTVCKHTKSNAIVYARAGQTVGVGAGQMSRVDSVRLGASRAQLPVAGSVLASDAFFPFRDGLDEAAKHGITAVIQPGGSVRDAEVIAAADEHDLAMVFTGVRHFKH